MTTEQGALEVRVLRGLCVRTNAAGLSEHVDRLANYEWSQPDHAVVFAAIRGAVGRRAAITRETLVALATRAGFPELQWDLYFAGGTLASLEDAVGDLLRSTR